MRLLKIGLYALLVLALQTVVFARLNLFGAAPDLILVSVIIFAILAESRSAVIYAAAVGFLQDILSHGIYINMIIKIPVAFLVSNLKEGFAGEEFTFALSAVAVLTPLTLLAEGAFCCFFSGRQVDILGLAMLILLSTLYNLALVPLLLPLARRAARA
jgi:rod shape-determining protein MreD